jgi:hypothetical protein
MQRLQFPNLLKRALFFSECSHYNSGPCEIFGDVLGILSRALAFKIL